MSLPRHAERLLHLLERRGYRVTITVEGDTPVSAGEIKGLAGIVQERVKAMRDKAQAVNNELNTSLNEADMILDHVGSMSADLRRATQELQSALGIHTNGPPVDEKK